MSKEKDEMWSDWTDHEVPDEKTKSQIKREMQDLQDLGVELVKLSSSQLDKIAMSDSLRSAINHCQRITSNGARVRQQQLIGKLMREENVEPIQQGLNEIRFSAQKQAQAFHQLERWRDRLIKEGDGALNEYLQEHPSADRQQLRTLIRQAQKEASENKAPAAARELFRILRDLVAEQ
jgi:ribosome-associated protein